MEVKAEYLAIFSEEASDQLREWEESLLALETAPQDKDPLNNMFRAIHTLKGSAGFIGFEALQKLAHDIESSLSSVRDGARPYDGTLGDLLFKGLDIARTLIDDFTAGRKSNQDVDGFLARLAESAGAPNGGSPAARKGAETPKKEAPKTPAPKTAAAASVVPGPAAPAPAPAPAAPTGPLQTSSLVVKIDGQNREAWLRSCIVKARLDRLGTVLDMQPQPDVLRESTEPFVYTVTIAAAVGAAELAGSISIDQVSVSPAANEPAAHEGAASTEDTSTEDTAKGDDQARPSAAEPAADLSRTARPDEVVRVSVQKLDTLLNLVGELVIHNSGFIATTQLLREQFGKTPFVYDLEEKTEALSAITRDLQDGIMKARMLPIASVFNRFRRVVRDLAKSSGKSVILDVFGEDTEIDKKVIDRIGEPLVHLVRNAMDHGLEPSGERERAGKAAAGTIRLGAYQEGDHICIEVSDDGRGLDRAAIVQKALEKKLISAEEAPRANVEQVLGFIFLPGFSTARVVSDISGRGVGMDAVKRAVDEMNGNIRVRSTPGAGTTVTISLPLTMAIITAVLVEASGSTFAIPMSAVREIVKTTDATLKTVGNQRVILLRDEVLSLVQLASTLRNGTDRRHLPAAPAPAPAPALTAESSRNGRPVIVVDFEGRKIGLEVDGILGSREVVIKSLSRHYREVEGLIGASILGNGKIALIVDVETMIGLHHGGAIHHGGSVASVVKEVAAAPASAPVAKTASALQAEPAARAEPAAPAADPAAVITPEQPAETVPAAVDTAPAEPTVDSRLEELARDVAGARGRLLEDVNNTGAIQASVSLSQLTGHEIRVSFPESRLVAIRDIAEIMGGEENVVGGMYVGVQGDLDAGMLLVVPEKNLLVLDDLLHGRPVGTIGSVADVDLSGISEMGNILASCFINAIADATHLRLSPEVPEISVDMCLSVIDAVLARFNQPGDKLLMTEAVILGEGAENVVCHQVLFLEPDSLRRLMAALAGELQPSGSAQAAQPQAAY